MNVRRIFSLPNVTLVMLSWLPVQWLAGDDQDSMHLVNLLTLFVILVGCLGAGVTNIAVSPIRLWFPINWFLITAAVYYGFGPLLYYFGTEETIKYCDAFFYVGDGELHRANLLNLAGISMVMGVYILIGKHFARSHSDHDQVEAGYCHKDIQPELWRMSIIFALVGIPIKLLFVLPRALGLWDVVLPGGFEYFSVLSTLALASLFILYRSNKVIYALPFYALLMLEGVTAFITLSKLAIFKVGIVLLLAAVLTGTKVKRLIMIVLIGAVSYGVVLTPLVTLSRIDYGKGLTSLSDTQSSLERFVQRGRYDEAHLLPGVQSWWARLNYASAQSFAMTAYDQGRSGDTFDLALYAFIPRILFPDKPIMTSGADFNVLVTGNSYSQSAPGFFAEAYWNGGWPMVIFTYLFLGVFYWGWEAYTKPKLKCFNLAYMPVIWMGLFSGIQQDSWFSATTVGVIPTAIVFHFMAVLFLKRTTKRRR